MKKKIMFIAGAVGIALILLIFLVTHVWIDGAFFPRGAESYDLTGHDLSAQEYEAICQRFPEAEIIWSVPFQGQRYPMDTTSLTVTSLTEAEADSLDYLPSLQQVDGAGCRDYGALAYLQRRRPDCLVHYQVDLGGIACGSLSQALTVTDADADALAQALPLLPRLQELNLEGTIPGPEELGALMEDFPAISFRFTLELGGQTVSSDAQTLDLTAAPVTREELSAVLPLLHQLEEVILMDTALPDGELRALIDGFPGIFFRCALDFAGVPCATDCVEADISGHPVGVEEVEAMLPYFPKLQKLIMSDCGIDDEAMDALNRRYPEISIVWTVQIGIVPVRTDDVIFFPAGVSESNMPSNEELKKLRYCTEMVAVDIGHAKATECEWLEYMPHVRYLILADTLITDLTPLSNLKELVYLEIFRMDLHDYSPLLGCTALQDLNIGTTYADPEPISQMTWLHNLQWNHGADDPETRDAVLQLAEQLPDTNVTIDTWRNVGGAWRYLPNYYVFRDLIGGKYFNQLFPSLFWGDRDAAKILGCEQNKSKFAGDVLAEIVRKRIDSGEPIVGVKNIGSEKAEVLYQTLVQSRATLDSRR